MQRVSGQPVKAVPNVRGGDACSVSARQFIASRPQCEEAMHAACHQGCSSQALPSVTSSNETKNSNSDLCHSISDCVELMINH